jgi:hypothetical protein
MTLDEHCFLQVLFLQLLFFTIKNGEMVQSSKWSNNGQISQYEWQFPTGLTTQMIKYLEIGKTIHWNVENIQIPNNILSWTKKL